MTLLIRTRHAWIAHLSAQSNIIASFQLHQSEGDGEIGSAVNIANCRVHGDLIAKAIQELVTGKYLVDSDARNILRRLMHRETYAALSELLCYYWLIRHVGKIEIPFKAFANETLCANDVILDGRIIYGNTSFDVKAFGLNGLLAMRLKEKLEENIPGKEVYVEESWDIPQEEFGKLISDAPNIANELRQMGVLRIGPIQLRIDEPKSITISGRLVEPYQLARDNVLCPFKDAHQFTTNRPFLLIFIIHPWFNYFGIGNDFNGVDTCCTRSLARRAFMELDKSKRLLAEICPKANSRVSLSDASLNLSGILFLNMRLEHTASSIGFLPSWLYVNPRANQPLPPHLINLFRSEHINVDDFMYDNY
jgi:hypothetical protein